MLIQNQLEIKLYNLNKKSNDSVEDWLEMQMRQRYARNKRIIAGLYHYRETWACEDEPCPVSEEDILGMSEDLFESMQQVRTDLLTRLLNVKKNSK